MQVMTQNLRSIAAPALGERYGTVGAIDILLVGGDLLFREGLKRLFAETPVRVCAEVESLGSDGLSGLEKAPDVIVFLDAPAMQGAGSPAELRQAMPGTRAVMLARRAEAGSLSAAVEAGIDGYLLTDMSPAALVQALNLVRLGENVFPTRLTADVFRHRSALDGSAGRPVHLTRRELDILNGLLDGQSNKMIANHLGTTDATVKAQLRHLLRKIGADNRTQAALWAREHGIVRGAARAA